MIHVQYRGRLGNNLFQYALGRILAQELGFALSAAAIPYFAPTTEAVDGERHDGPVQLLSGQQIDFASIISDRRPRQIVLHGGFQDFRYYRPYEAQIRRWFRLPPRSKPRHDLIVHVRRTDYLPLSWALPFSFYEKAITAALPESGRVHIATDDPNDPFFWRFARWKPKFIRADELTTLAQMANARALVMSQSSFAWWAAFLAPEPQQVICPVPSYGVWSARDQRDQVNLIMADRFTCIPCPEPYRLHGVEKLYFAMRYPGPIARRRLRAACNSLWAMFSGVRD